MWYLQANTLLLLTLLVLVTGISRRLLAGRHEQLFLWLLAAAEAAILTWISVPLSCFYLVYLAFGYLTARLLHRFPKGWLFALLSAAALIPFLMARYVELGGTLPFTLVTIGLTFSVLRVIDIYYHVFYTGLDISLPVYVNYMLFLPVFTSGPVYRYREFDAAVRKPVTLTASVFTDAFKRTIRGLFKKIVVSALLLQALQSLLAVGCHWYISLAVTLCSYLVMYTDLSGYSDIAIAYGTAAGFTVPENFNKPWEAPSFTIFWRRWHASLSGWIRDHVFILVNRRRLKKYQTALLCIVTMVIMSLWHGFRWTYLFAGAYNGILLAAENLLGLTTVNRRKTKPVVFRLRCLLVNFLFALNTLVFLLEPEQLLLVLKGFISL